MAHFFDLPFELRGVIYELAMEDVRMDWMMVPSSQRHFLGPSILLANRRYQHEIRAAVFKHATIGVRIGWQMSAMFVRGSYMRNVRKIEFRIPIPLASAEKIDEMISSLPELAEITISALSPLAFLSDLDDSLHAHEALSREAAGAQPRLLDILRSGARDTKLESSEQSWVRSVFRHRGVIAGRRKIATKACGFTAAPQTSA